MRLATAAATAAMLAWASPARADGPEIGTEIQISGIACSRGEDAVRLLRVLSANAALIESRADVMALAEREQLSCRILHGLDVIYAGVVETMPVEIGGKQLEIIRLARGTKGDLFTWRPRSKPGASI